MEARNSFFISLSVLLATCLFQNDAMAQRGYRVVTKNFVINAPDSRLAQAIALKAETFRKELSQQWLGYEIADWKERCPIDVQIAMHAGGETSFAFVDNGTGNSCPISWQMRIFGPPDRILDAVLPHEITHTIFATHFGRPLPRWADEGACTTVEHQSEREKNHRMLIDFLTSKPSRGIPFNRMFVMREYPHDILPLYAQGYSLARFLINQKGRKQFIKYVSAGLENEKRGREVKSWDEATKRYYGFDNLSDLQVSWLAWVRSGSKDVLPAETYAVAEAQVQIKGRPQSAEGPDDNESWYARQSSDRESARIATNRQAFPATMKPVKPLHSTPSGLPSKTVWR